jgi:hypothetical protein
MITIDHPNAPDGLSKPRFLRKFTLKNVVKAAFAPHTLIPKRHRGQLIKMAFAPHLLLRKKR